MPITFLFWLRSPICLPIQRTLTYDPHMKVPQGIVSFAQAMIAVKKATVRKFLRSSKLVILLRKILFLSFLFSRVLIFSREFYSLRGAKSRGVKKPFYSLKLALRKRFQLLTHWKEAHHIRPLSFSFMPKFFLLQKILILIKIHSLNNYCYFSHCMKEESNKCRAIRKLVHEWLKELFMSCFIELKLDNHEREVSIQHNE